MALTRDGLWGSASAIRRIHGGGSLASPWCDETVALTDLTLFRIGVAGQLHLKIKLHAKELVLDQGMKRERKNTSETWKMEIKCSKMKNKQYRLSLLPA